MTSSEILDQTIRDAKHQAWLELRARKLREWVPDEHALSFLNDVSRISELWDDLIDQDKTITPEAIHSAMLSALISLPLNPFYQRHSTYLTPLMIHAINAWQDANQLSQGTRSQRALAYTLRHFDTQMLTALVNLTQGYSKMREVSAEIWTFFVAEPDDFDEWMRGDKTT